MAVVTLREASLSVYRYPVPPASEITPKSVVLNRRAFMAGAAGLAFASQVAPARAAEKLTTVASPFSTDEAPNPLDDISGYCNFYEFGTGKGDPASYAGDLTTRPWTIEVGGLVNNPGTLDIDDLMTNYTLEDRIYRLRCVEAWSMVVPWVGIPLASVLEKFDVQGSAKYVAFETLVRPEEMPGQRAGYRILPWPYVEGLRLDEAMHPLTILAVGLHGEVLPNQNGAPVRLVVPWKYGFKSIKSIVSIKFTEEEPPATWNLQNPREYGFYSNVNPQVDHPRWSQATERRIGGGLFAKRVETQMFNGYADQVASLYEGMDLSKYF
ncbi:protein-methionine-sulfoxide reductase catalytic subunit MsrP [Oricola sp.]|uniref:protein-methionine-sulfoxide reductase catalytic subunit MsrP n=1 Tax=Oricola sp. TaxID=1979950 RepID=UPI0025E79C3C|nr:protein-methionine-sulfoxide reductase catalytic subunit MsrP [Oricola sp.]MCI5074258.1 protein-methionine-sulfoxide reductase catalytic subunit MsrP [Oricola sp.]